MRLIGNCDTAPTFIQAMCMDLQEECVEALVDMVEHPEDRENTIQKKYHRCMFHEPDHSIFTRLGRVKAEYEPRIMLKNLQYLDMKAAIDSYMTGYKRDRHELHQWLRQVIQTN